MAPAGPSTKSYTATDRNRSRSRRRSARSCPNTRPATLTIDVERQGRGGPDGRLRSRRADHDAAPASARPCTCASTAAASACVVDGGVVDNDGGTPTPSPRCGNGRVDPGETCDTAIPAGRARRLPAVAATTTFPARRTRPTAASCTAKCVHGTTRRSASVLPGDGCCPAGTSQRGDMDPDCSPTCGDGVVDPNETCDIAHPARHRRRLPDPTARPAPPAPYAMLVSGQHLLGGVRPLSDRRADRQATGRLLSTRRHQRRRQRLRRARAATA